MIQSSNKTALAIFGKLMDHIKTLKADQALRILTLARTDGFTPLIDALNKKSPQMAMLIIEEIVRRVPDPTERKKIFQATDIDGFNALHRAAWTEIPKAV